MARHFPNIIDAYLRYTEEHESTLKIRKWCAISIIAGAMERRLYLDRGYYKLFSNLYTFIVAPSGIVKKTTSTGIAVNMLREVEGIKIMSERMTSGSLVEQMCLAGKKYEHEYQTFTQSALFAYASELAVFMEEVFGDITSLLTTFYDCVPNDSSKPWVYGTIGRGERRVFGPCLNILGASTKPWLQRCIPSSEQEAGFSSRIIFVVENDIPDKLVAWPEVNEDLELMRLKIIEDLRAVACMCGKLKVHVAAKLMFRDWYSHHMKVTVKQNTKTTMSGYMARKGDTILKLGMIHSAARGDSKEISIEDLIWAEKELTALEPSWTDAFSEVIQVTKYQRKF